MLVELDHIIGILDIAVGQLRDMHQAVLMDADIDEGAEVGDVGHDARKLHARHEVVDGMHAGVELERLGFAARVEAGLLQFLHDIVERRHAHRLGDIAVEVDAAACGRVLHQVTHAAAAVLGHVLHHGVALRVDGAGVERVLGAGDAQEAGALREGGRTEARHFLQLLARGEGAMLTAVVDDVLRQRWPEPTDVGQQVLRRRVDVDADGIDAQLHRLVEAVAQLRLVDVVLILSHADALRVNLHQFGQRIHQSAADAHGAAHSDILVGELLARHLRRRVDARAILAHHVGGDVADLPQHVGGLPRSGTVAAGDGFHLPLAGDGNIGTALAVGRLHIRADGVVEQVALRVEHHHLAAGADAGVDTHHPLLTQRRGEE